MNASPFTVDRVLDINEEDFKNTRWTCCCSKKPTDSRLLKFIGIYIMMFSTLSFCLVQLSFSKTCEDTTSYMSLLTLLLGIIVPHPKP